MSTHPSSNALRRQAVVRSEAACWWRALHPGHPVGPGRAPRRLGAREEFHPCALQACSMGGLEAPLPEALCCGGLVLPPSAVLLPRRALCREPEVPRDRRLVSGHRVVRGVARRRDESATRRRDEGASRRSCWLNAAATRAPPAADAG